MKKSILTIAVALLIGLSSCTKDNDVIPLKEEDTDIGEYNSDSVVRLKSYTILGVGTTCYTYYEDGKLKEIFTYDNDLQDTLYALFQYIGDSVFYRDDNDIYFSYYLDEHRMTIVDNWTAYFNDENQITDIVSDNFHKEFIWNDGNCVISKMSNQDGNTQRIHDYHDNIKNPFKGMLPFGGWGGMEAQWLGERLPLEAEVVETIGEYPVTIKYAFDDWDDGVTMSFEYYILKK